MKESDKVFYDELLDAVNSHYYFGNCKYVIGSTKYPLSELGTINILDKENDIFIYSFGCCIESNEYFFQIQYQNEPENKYFKSNEIALFLDQVVEAKKIIEEERTNLKELMKFLNENPNIQYRFSKQDVVLTCGKKEIRVSIYSYFLIENTGQIKEYFEYIILDSEYIYEVTLPELKELIIKNCYCSK